MRTGADHLDGDELEPQRSTMRLFGFPVHVKPGFFMFMLLIVMINGGTSGIWFAAGIAVFTLLHELGHALAARRTGAEAEISLDFLFGYASYTPTRHLARWERAGIALAGPATQIVLGTVVLLALGINPLLRSDVAETDLSLAIWWTGPVLGLLNLLPLMPLDGGNIVAAGLDKLMPGRGLTAMTVISLPLTLVLLVVLAIDDTLWGLAPFMAFLLVFQLQNLSARHAARGDERHAPEAHPAQLAEDAAWRTGRADPLTDDGMLSPWFRANVLLRAGRPDEARDVLVSDLTLTQGASAFWTAPNAAPPTQLAPLVDLLPRPLPSGNVYAEVVLVGILLRLGLHEDAVHYGAESYRRSPTAACAISVARGVAALGDGDLAVRWLHAAALGAHPALVAQAIDHAPELAAVRHRPEVQDLRAESLAVPRP